MTLPAFAAECGLKAYQAVDRYLLQAPALSSKLVASRGATSSEGYDCYDIGLRSLKGRRHGNEFLFIQSTPFLVTPDLRNGMR